ncbi:MAG: HEAT repeat domain-containing protein [Kofleriaceae bacterium]
MTSAVDPRAAATSARRRRTSPRRSCLALGVALVAACGGGGAAAPTARPPLLPWGEPALGDPAAEGAPYLALVAARLAPEWRHFLEDCRVRLPIEHPLNELGLEATAAIIVDAKGALVSHELRGSGNADFDAAVGEVIASISPLPPPPAWLLSDDDLLRLSWRFARDQRQASAVGAQVEWLEQPAAQVVARRLGVGDLGGAARRAARLPDGDAQLREIARQVFVAAIAEGLGGDGQAQRAAIEAARRAALRELTPQVVTLAGSTDPAVRGAAARALAALEDPAAAPTLLEHLAATRDPRLAAALVRGLAAMGAAADAERAVLKLGDGDRDAQLTALGALAELPSSPALLARVTRWSTSRDAALRAGLCTAVATAKVPAAVRWDLLGRGMDDRDGSTRAACTAALHELAVRPLPWMRAALRRLIDDRDQRVRAAAITSLMRWDPLRLDERLRTLVADSNPDVRAATVAALSRRSETDALRALLSDPEPMVRRTAALALALVDGPAVRDVAVRDADPRVRLVALEIREGLPVTLKALANDESPEVRTEVEVLHVTHRGESLQSGLVRLAGTQAASPERVRIALAWLLAT